MKLYKTVILLALSCCLALAKPVDFVDWSGTPNSVLERVKAEGAEAKLVGFHKTGVPYIKGKLSTLGNHWDLTVYFDEQDHPNQVLLQLEDVSRSGLTRVQKLAVGDFGKDYKVRHAEGDGRKDTFFEWSLPTQQVVLNSAQRRGQETHTVWLKITPPK